MSAAWRRRALFLATWALSAVLSFALLQVLLNDGSDDGRAESPPPVVASLSPDPTGTTADALDGVELTATLADINDDLTFMVTERQARASLPPQVRDCRQFASWAYQNGAIPVGPEPRHLLTMRAEHAVDVTINVVEAVPVAEIPLDQEQGPWVALSCREAQPAPTGTPETAEDNGPYRLTPGKEVRLPVELEGWGDRPFPNGVWNYYLRVAVEIDGVVQVHELRDEAGKDFRCCGRITFMGYLAAQYEWSFSPTPMLRYCAEQRYVGEPPPLVCRTIKPG